MDTNKHIRSIKTKDFSCWISNKAYIASSFDVILFNTPYLPTDNEDVIEDNLNYAFDGGLNGRKVIDLFLDEVKNHLNPKGIVQLIQSSLSDNEKTLDRLDEMGFIAEIAESEHFFFEDVVLING